MTPSVMLQPSMSTGTYVISAALLALQPLLKLSLSSLVPHHSAYSEYITHSLTLQQTTDTVISAPTGLWANFKMTSA